VRAHPPPHPTPAPFNDVPALSIPLCGRYARAHLLLLTRLYRKQLGRATFLVGNSSPRQSQLEADIFLAAWIMSVHYGLLSTVENAVDESADAVLQEGTASFELYKFAVTSRSFWQRCPSIEQDAQGTAESRRAVVELVVSVFKQQIVSEDILAWARYRTQEFPPLVSLLADVKTTEAALLMVDSERLLSETKCESGASMFHAGQRVALLLCGAGHGWK
jgi:hypothetical protein